jgi:D-amino-acid oxidase
MSTKSYAKASLAYGRDLSALPTALRAPTVTSPRVLVVGGGVTGLVNAWLLLDKGYRVTVVSKEWASYGQAQRLTSQIAGALWEFPPAVCGQHTDAISLQRSKPWAMVSYHIWDAISQSGELAGRAGVQMRKADFFFPTKLEDDAVQMARMEEIMAQDIRGFRRHRGIVGERRVDPAYGVVDAYEHLAPVIDTDVCMEFLKDLVTAKGAKLITRTIVGDLFDQEASLLAEFSAQVIINCTGLAATELAGDKSCYPIRGGLIRVVNDGRDFPKVNQVLVISADAMHDANEIVFLVPRNDDILLIGGIAEPNLSSLDLTLDSPIIKRMRARCEAFLPDLRNARVDVEYPVAQGLRPFRPSNVRVERELRLHPGGRASSIVHNYGHGGSGWTLSFGCAGDVLALVGEALLDASSQPAALEVVLPRVLAANDVHTELQKSNTSTMSAVRAKL